MLRQPADQVVRLLLLRSAWWDLIPAADHELLAALPGWHAELFRWLERWLLDHGPEAWPVLRDAMAPEPWAAEATALVDGAEVQLEVLQDDLLQAIRQVRKAQELQQAMEVLGRL